MRALLLAIFSIVLVAAGTAHAESLVDIKVEDLAKPVKPKWGTDPFMRFDDKYKAAEEDLGPTDLNVEGIISNGDKALAIINGGFYRKGDNINGYVIKDILNDRVLLIRGGKDYVLTVRGFTANGPGKEAGQ